MALVDVDSKWVLKMYEEEDSVEVYEKLIRILHFMMDDDVYTIDKCFNDLLSLAKEIRRRISESKFPLNELHLDDDGHGQPLEIKCVK